VQTDAGHEVRKILRQKAFPYFVQILLGCKIHLQNDFFQNFQFKVKVNRYSSNSFIASVVVIGDKLSHVSLSPVSLLPAINTVNRQCHGIDVNPG
jgi:hypothetical protein